MSLRCDSLAMLLTVKKNENTSINRSTFHDGTDFLKMQQFFEAN